MTDDPDLMMSRLQDLVAHALDATDGMIDHAPWCVPRAGSDAASDLAGSQWGEAPVRDALDIAWMAIGAAASETLAFGAVLPGARTCYAPEVLARAALESASLALWLLEPGIGPRKRVARSIAYRLSGATHMERALDHLTLREGEERGDYGELRDDVVEEASGLGLSPVRSPPHATARHIPGTRPGYLGSPRCTSPTSPGRPTRSTPAWSTQNFGASGAESPSSPQTATPTAATGPSTTRSPSTARPTQLSAHLSSPQPAPPAT
jgi:hypothetical protein